jgi:hypothetical protein
MGLYVFFPIGVFYTATHPDLFLQRTVEKERKEYEAEYYSESNMQRVKQLEKLRQDVNSKLLK